MDLPPNINPPVRCPACCLRISSRHGPDTKLTLFTVLQPRKVAVPIASPHPFVPADTSGLIFKTANMKLTSVLPADSPAFGNGDGFHNNSWPAVGVTEESPAALLKLKLVPESKVHDAILRYFAKQFILMGRDELQLLQLADLDIIL